MCMCMYVSQAGHRCVPVEGQGTSCLGNTFFLERARAPGETTRKAAAVFLQGRLGPKLKRARAPGRPDPKRRTPLLLGKGQELRETPARTFHFPIFYGLLFTWRADSERAVSGIREGGDTRTPRTPFSPAAGLFSSRAARLRRSLPRRTQNRRDRERREATKARGQGREK